MDSQTEVGMSFEESRSRVSRPGILPKDVALGYDEWAQSDKYDKVRKSLKDLILVHVQN